jgi:hypothetical protein
MGTSWIGEVGYERLRSSARALSIGTSEKWEKIQVWEKFLKNHMKGNNNQVKMYLIACIGLTISEKCGPHFFRDM